MVRPDRRSRNRPRCYEHEITELHMAKTLCFDEQEPLDSVLVRYRRLAETTGLPAADQSAGEAVVRTFHNALSESIALGNQAHFEKHIGHGNVGIRLVALPRCQRSIFSRLVARFLGK